MGRLGLDPISRRLSVPLRSFSKPLSLDSYAMSQSLFPSCCSLRRVRKWPALENAPPPVTTCTSSTLPRMQLKYFYCADVTGFRRPIPAFFTGIVLRDPMARERVFVFLRQRQGKNLSRSIFSTPAKASTVS